MVFQVAKLMHNVVLDTVRVIAVIPFRSRLTSVVTSMVTCGVTSVAAYCFIDLVKTG